MSRQMRVVVAPLTRAQDHTATLANPCHQCMPMQGLTLCLFRADSLRVLEVDMQMLAIK